MTHKALRSRSEVVGERTNGASPREPVFNQWRSHGDGALIDEFLDAAAPKHRHLDQLISAGVRPEAMFNAGWVQVARIEPTGSGLYQPSEDGTEAFVLCVRDLADEIVDLVAWRPDAPQRWWLRKGLGVILGAAQADYSGFLGRSLSIYPTPQSWLKAGGAGICVLDRWTPELWAWHLHGVRRVVVHDRDLARKVERSTRRPLPPPVKIRIAHEEASHAAEC